MENNHVETKKKIDLTYYRARFSQKFGAMIIDFVVFAILGLLLFMGAKGIVEATPKFYEINHNLEVAQVNSSLYIYSSDRDRVEDIVTYINYRKDMSSSEIETFLTTRIYDFFDSLPEYKEELTNEYLELISRSDLTYNNEPYFIKNENGELSAVKTVKVKFETNPETGRREMVEVAGSEEVIPCELCLIAAGFLGSQSYVTSAFGVEIDGRTNVLTEKGDYATSVEKVFTAGDMHRGQSLVVWAIQEGKEAAKAVDESLMGYTNL